MVRLIYAAVAASLVAASLGAGPVMAQSVDWRRAGGGLFVEPEREPDAAAVSEAPDLPRIAALSQPFGAAIDAAAQAHGLDPKLLHALVITESAYKANARSPVGAVGLTQLMPATAFDLGVRDRLDPVENLRGGADYLARQIVRFGDIRLALAAYNSGPTRVARLGRIPEIAETRAYVASVIECYLALTAGRSVRSSNQCRPPEALP